MHEYENNQDLIDLLREALNEISDINEENKNLRDAGDALVGALDNGLYATAVVLVNKWKEIRND